MKNFCVYGGERVDDFIMEEETASGGRSDRWVLETRFNDSLGFENRDSIWAF